MKKAITVFIAVLLLAAIGLTVATAAGRRNHYTDENLDGICDNSTTSAACTGNYADDNGICNNKENNTNCNNSASCNRYTDADNNGICDNKNTNCNSNYTDTDNNGICDNKGTNCANGSYTDENNDGVCDNRNENTGCRNKGNHHGKGHR